MPNIKEIDQVESDQSQVVAGDDYLPCERPLDKTNKGRSLGLREVYFDEGLDAFLPKYALLEIRKQKCSIDVTQYADFDSTLDMFLSGRINDKTILETLGKTAIEVENICEVKLAEKQTGDKKTWRDFLTIKGVAMGIPFFYFTMWAAAFVASMAYSHMEKVMPYVIFVSALAIVVLVYLPSFCPQKQKTVSFQLPGILPLATRKMIEEAAKYYARVYLVCNAEGAWRESDKEETQVVKPSVLDVKIIGTLKRRDKHGFHLGTCTLLQPTI